jgi:hypothetical protein
MTTVDLLHLARPAVAPAGPAGPKWQLLTTHSVAGPREASIVLRHLGPAAEVVAAARAEHLDAFAAQIKAAAPLADAAADWTQLERERRAAAHAAGLAAARLAAARARRQLLEVEAKPGLARALLDSDAELAALQAAAAERDRELAAVAPLADRARAQAQAVLSDLLRTRGRQAARDLAGRWEALYSELCTAMAPILDRMAVLCAAQAMLTNQDPPASYPTVAFMSQTGVPAGPAVKLEDLADAAQAAKDPPAKAAGPQKGDGPAPGQPALPAAGQPAQQPAGGKGGR